MQSKVSPQKIQSIFKQFKKLKIFVVGDAMLDKYWMGNIERISPEAPVPILNIQHKDSRPGGAANVALNCKSLGAEVSLLTVLGNDKDGHDLAKLLAQQSIITDNILYSKDRITTTKTRVIAKNQHVMRVDEESTGELLSKVEHQFIDICLKAIQIDKPDILIFEDYNKGVLKANVIEKIMTHCQHVGVLTAVDPKKTHFLQYKGVDIFKPNLKEIRDALGLSLAQINITSMKEVHAKLASLLQHQVSLITLSEHGVFTQSGKEAALYPAHIRNIADVSGAGDTVIAVAAMVYFVTKDIHLAAQIANLAGGIVCEEVGVVPISQKKLLTETLAVLG